MGSMDEDELAYKALVHSVLLFNGGLLCGWLVGLLTGNERDAKAVSIGVVVVILFGVYIAVWLFRRMRDRYELSFYLTGSKRPKTVDDVKKFSPAESMSMEGGAPSLQSTLSLPGGMGEASANEGDVVHVTVDYPSARQVEDAEIEIRKVLEEGRPEDIDAVVHKHTRLIKYLNTDVLWAGELLQVRLSAAALAVDRARQTAEAAELRIMSSGGELIAPTDSASGGDPLQIAAAASIAGASAPQFSAQLSASLSANNPAVIAASTDIESKMEDHLDYLGAAVHDAQAKLRYELGIKAELKQKLEQMQDTVDRLESYKLVHEEERQLLAQANIKHEADLKENRAKLEKLTQQLDQMNTDRFELLADTGKLCYIAPYVAKRIDELSAETKLAAIGDAGDARDICSKVVEQLGGGLSASAYLSQFPLFSSGEGNQGELPDHLLIYTAANTVEESLLSKKLPKEKCVLTYEVVNQRKVLFVPAVDKNTRLHLWRTERRDAAGQLMLVPLVDEKANKVLGVLGVDTMTRGEKALSDEEKNTIERAAERMTLAIIQGRAAQERCNASLIDVAKTQVREWASGVEQRVKIHSLKTRLEAVLSTGSPEAAAFATEVATYTSPPRPVIAICTALFVVLTGENSIAEQIEQRLEKGTGANNDAAYLKMWAELVQPGLGEMGSEVPVLMQHSRYRSLSAVNTRIINTVESMLSGVSIQNLRGAYIILYIYPWLVAVLSLYRLSEIPIDDVMFAHGGGVQEAPLSEASIKLLEKIERKRAAPADPTVPLVQL